MKQPKYLNLGKKTIEKMRAVIAAVLREPAYYEQNVFPSTEDCGSTCCAAGWTVWLDDPEKYADLAQRFGARYDWTGRAVEALGLNKTQDPDLQSDIVDKLFMTTYAWPTTFRVDYYFAKTPAARARVMAARWEHFIATDGRV